MSISEARRRANDKWREKFELIQFRVPKGKKSVIQEHAAQCGESLNGFINRAVDQALSADGKKKVTILGPLVCGSGSLLFLCTLIVWICRVIRTPVKVLAAMT